MSPDELGPLLRARLGADFPRPTLNRLHETSGGNPFLALEIARALLREGAMPKPGEALPVPDNVHDLLAARLRELPAGSGETLLAPCCRGPRSG